MVLVSTRSIAMSFLVPCALAVLMDIMELEVQESPVGLRLFAFTIPPDIALDENISENTIPVFEDFGETTSIVCTADGTLLAINSLPDNGMDLQLNDNLVFADNDMLAVSEDTISNGQEHYINKANNNESTIVEDDDVITISSVDNIKEESNIDNNTELFLDDSGNVYVLTDNEGTDNDEEPLQNDQSSFSCNNYLNVLQQYGLTFPEEDIISNNDFEQGFTETVQEEIESDGNEVDIETLADIVQALKCKECSFTTLDRSALIDHHQQFHLQNILTDSDNCKVTDDNDDSQKQVTYVCAQCYMQLPTVLACRLHMIHDHNLQPSKPTQRKSNASIEETEMALINDDTKSNETNSQHLQTPPLSNIDSETDADDPVVNESKTNIQQTNLSNPEELSPVLQALRDYWLLPKTTKEIKMRLCSDRKIKCTIRQCLYRFSSLEAMMLHRACHSGGISVRSTAYQRSPQRAPTPPYTCSICNETYNTWPSCSLHLWRAHNSIVDLLQCPICSKIRIHSVGKMVRHLALHARSYRKKKSCEKCELKAEEVDMDEYKNTPMSHKWYNQKRCEICKKLYANSKILKKHIQAVHNKIKPFICNVCGHSAASKHMLQLHMRQHTGEKPFSCEFCPYRTGDHNTLRKHRMRHTGERPYSCPYCKYTSIQSGCLQHHIKHTHPDKPPLKCHHKKPSATD